MKSVMISIRPEWCELIANGKKTVEVRKSKPKLDTPFKCYIYCTKGNPLWLTMCRTVVNDEAYNRIIDDLPIMLNRMVIGEFICDALIPISVKYSNPDINLALKEFPYTCLTDKQIIDYLGNGVMGYGWHISNLKIYDTPKELSEFKTTNRKCYYSDLGWAKNDCDRCIDCNLKRPPQSWCYVEELLK